jgi:hypothetical protein
MKQLSREKSAFFLFFWAEKQPKRKPPKLKNRDLMGYTDHFVTPVFKEALFAR